MAKAPKGSKEPQADGGKRHWLSARTTAELSQSLKDAAQKSGRSVSQEIEFRLEQSFNAEASEAAARAKSPMRPLDAESEALFRSITNAAGAAMTHMRASWVGNIYARAAVKNSIVSVLNSYINNNRIEVQSSELDFRRLENAARVGEMFGRLLGDLNGAPGGDALLQEVRDILTPLAPTLGEAVIPGDMRRDAALADLNVSIAA